MLTLHKLLHAQTEPDAYFSQIRPTDDQEAFLRACRNTVRDFLRPRIAAATTTLLGMPREVSPRFRTQGSWNYGTCVQPCQQPPQEMDWDYGVYLPVEVWKDNGPPAHMAKAYFLLVESLLEELCRNEGWKLSSEKSTCSRIELASWAHMDVPLYAASAEQFEKVVEASHLAKAFGRASMEGIVVMDSADFDELPQQTWDELHDIVLATREGIWKPSDPANVATWFRDRLDEAGTNARQLRRVCRYLKAWRDFHWDTGGPTSVAIMIAVARNFRGVQGRDDIALQYATELSYAMAHDLHEPGIDGGEEDFNRLNAEQRSDASIRASRLGAAINSARNLGYSQRQVAISTLQSQLGRRVPNRPEWVESDSSGVEIREIPAKRVNKPAVETSKAG
jgi:hypothetical protein